MKILGLGLVLVVLACEGEASQTEDTKGPDQVDAMEVGNPPPVALDDVAEGAENAPLALSPLDNDTDPEGGTLVISEVSEAVFGFVRITDGGRALSYAPGLNFDGVEILTYTVVEPEGASAQAQITITITGKNDAPTAVLDRVAARLGEDSLAEVLLNDSDPEGDALSMEVIAPPEFGTVAVEPEGIRYAPRNPSDHDRIRYRITDPEGLSSEAEVIWTFYETLEDPAAPTVVLPPTGLTPRDFALVINTLDPVSVATGAYYAEQRGLSAAQIIEVAIPTDSDVLSPADFEPIWSAVEAALPEGTQAMALTGIRPYRVGCMSITSAFALGGYDDRYCNTSGGPCDATAPVATYGSDSLKPWEDHGVRPTMIVGGVDEAEARALIDRGVAADGTFPGGVGHLVHTTDAARSVRNPDYLTTLTQWEHSGGIEWVYTDNSDGSGSNTLSGEADVLFYFTGIAQVPEIETNTYVPGAIADHLTSFGGRLTSTSGQMSVMRWLEAGLSGSYGTVVEPCNYTQKFPRPSVLLPYYFRGGTLLEAYWKSVHWPGEGVFVGEPLARPWGHGLLRYSGGDLTISTTSLEPGRSYSVWASDGLELSEAEIVLEGIAVAEHRREDIVVAGANRAVYWLVPSL